MSSVEKRCLKLSDESQTGRELGGGGGGAAAESAARVQSHVLSVLSLIGYKKTWSEKLMFCGPWKGPAPHFRNPKYKMEAEG